MNKKEKIETILLLMKEEGLTIKDLMDEAGSPEELAAVEEPEVVVTEESLKKFYFFCDRDSKLCRLSYGTVFPEGSKVPREGINVRGVFPFADDIYYIGLEETQELPSVGRIYSPHLVWWHRIVREGLVAPLNEIFRRLNAPILDGYYLASDLDSKGCAICIKAGQKTLGEVSYGLDAYGKGRDRGIYDLPY